MLFEREIIKLRVIALCSNQEQDDIEMFLAAKFVGSCGCNKLSIQAVNSDVAILVLQYAPVVKVIFKRLNPEKMKGF